MKILYFDCGMGAAGDMLAAALLDLLEDTDNYVKKLNSIGIEGISYRLSNMEKCGIRASHVSVMVGDMEEVDQLHETNSHHHKHHKNHHNNLAEINSIIDSLNISDRVRADAKAVYQLLAEAESKVHGRAISDIHFHEVGTMDALADVVAVCYLMNELKPDKVICSPVHVGMGQVKCAHGILPVPAPATARLLLGVPSYSDGQINGELCTPTGAALLKYFSREFGPLPQMTMSGIGYGCGSKDFPRANVVRAIIGNEPGAEGSTDQIVELRCNVDDCTAEELGFAMERLLEAGALDVYMIPVTSKKCRQGILFTCMCRYEDRDEMLHLIFKHTTTIGIREYNPNRYTLHRSIEQVDTPYGSVAIKEVSGYGVSRKKAEYEDLARIAREQKLGIDEVRRLVSEA